MDSLTFRSLRHNPSTYIDLIAQYLQPAQDLTGQITKDASYYFAYGGNADIWEGEWTQKHSGRIVKVAVKVLKGHHDPSKCKRLLRELRVWSAVQHEHIIPLLGVTFDFDRPYTPCLVSPYYQHRDITGFVKEQPSINKVALIAQVASAVSYLHSLSIIHGDLKGSNILIDDNSNARLTDFGLSRILQESSFTTTPSGTYQYMALELVAICEEEEVNSVTTTDWRWKSPEQIAARPSEKGVFVPRVTLASDVWAFAMTALEILTGSMPFAHIKSDTRVIHYILSGGRPKREWCWKINQDIWGTLEACWDNDPNHRPSAALLSRLFALQASLVDGQRARL